MDGIISYGVPPSAVGDGVTGVGVEVGGGGNVAVGVADGVNVAEGMAVAVKVGVAVNEAVGDAVLVEVGVKVFGWKGVGEMVGVAVMVGVLVMEGVTISGVRLRVGVTGVPVKGRERERERAK